MSYDRAQGRQDLQDGMGHARASVSAGHSSLTAHLTSNAEPAADTTALDGLRFLSGPPLLRKASGGDVDPFALHLTSAAASSSSGAPLPDSMRARAEQSLGTDLGGVRVHTGDASANAADAVGALAYTTGQDIHFARGQYAPGTGDGDRLLAHEIAHTVQQRPGADPQRKPTISQPGDTLEREADSAADAILAGGRFDVASGTAPGSAIQRVPRPTTAVNNGMITRELTVELHPGGRRVLHVGTYVEVVRRNGENLRVRVHSGFNGAEADIPADAFRAETEIGDASSRAADAPDERVMYREFRGRLWADAGPVMADIDQGSIGDCYLLAAMGAIVQANPARIRAMISPHTPDLPAYQVQLYEFNRSGRGMQPRTITVDTNFPVLRDAARRATDDLMYGGEGAATTAGRGGAPASAPALWPLLIEKAYAQLRGGYQNIDNDQHRQRGRTGEAQDTGDAMERLLGTRVDENSDPELAADADAIAGMVDAPMTADQRDAMVNPLRATGALLPRLRGYLDRHIAVEMATKQSPVVPGRNLELVDGSDPTLAHLYIRHEYVLQRVDGDRVFVFNPHGARGQLPRGLTEDEVRRYFDSITTSGRAVPDTGPGAT